MHWEFVFAGYSIVFGGILLYTFSVIRRGKLLSKKVPVERRRFLD